MTSIVTYENYALQSPFSNIQKALIVVGPSQGLMYQRQNHPKHLCIHIDM